MDSAFVWLSAPRSYHISLPPITANAARFGYAMLENDTMERPARIE